MLPKSQDLHCHFRRNYLSFIGHRGTRWLSELQPGTNICCTIGCTTRPLMRPRKVSVRGVTTVAVNSTWAHSAKERIFLIVRCSVMYATHPWAPQDPVIGTMFPLVRCLRLSSQLARTGWRPPPSMSRFGTTPQNFHHQTPLRRRRGCFERLYGSSQWRSRANVRSRGVSFSFRALGGTDISEWQKDCAHSHSAVRYKQTRTHSRALYR